ncbi:hypothetical protein TNCV_2947381 [Trichonephila clavipes]|nr:hypothetical protein TNCV_2947381 [Trichonephila clavipes]
MRKGDMIQVKNKNGKTWIKSDYTWEWQVLIALTNVCPTIHSSGKPSIDKRKLCARLLRNFAECILVLYRQRNRGNKSMRMLQLGLFSPYALEDELIAEHIFGQKKVPPFL